MGQVPSELRDDKTYQFLVHHIRKTKVIRAVTFTLALTCAALVVWVTPLAVAGVLIGAVFTGACDQYVHMVVLEKERMEREARYEQVRTLRKTDG